MTARAAKRDLFRDMLDSRPVPEDAVIVPPAIPASPRLSALAAVPAERG